MIRFRKVYRIRHDASYSKVMESRYILRNPEAILSIEDYLAPSLEDGQYRGLPKTQIDFNNGSQIVIIGDVDTVDRKLKEWEKNISMNIDGEEFIP